MSVQGFNQIYSNLALNSSNLKVIYDFNSITGSGNSIWINNGTEDFWFQDTGDLPPDGLEYAFEDANGNAIGWISGVIGHEGIALTELSGEPILILSGLRTGEMISFLAEGPYSTSPVDVSEFITRFGTFGLPTGLTQLLNVYIPSISGGKSDYVGILSFIDNFYQKMGSGYFTGQYIDINNASLLNSPNWTMFITYEKTGFGNSVLFSNYHGNTVKSGFLIGINDNNQPYFETYGNTPIVKTLTGNYNTKNILITTCFNNIINFGTYNFNNFTSDMNTFVLNITGLKPSNIWTIGKSINPPSYFSGNPFTGYIDDFIYITSTLTEPTLNKLASGLFSDQSTVYDVISKKCSYTYANLTGNITNITFEPINTMINLVETGYLNLKSGSGFAYLTGNITGNIVNASGYISGFTISGSGYNIVTTQFFTGITGYDTSGQIALINTTGHLIVNLGNITDVCMNIFNVSGISGITGITGYQSIFTNPITGITSGDITGLGISYQNIPFFQSINYQITGVSGSGYFVENSTYSNRGDNFIRVFHNVYYKNILIQPTPFSIYKTCNEVLGIVKKDGIINQDIIDSFLVTGTQLTIGLPIDGNTNIIYNNNGQFFNI